MTPTDPDMIITLGKLPVRISKLVQVIGCAQPAGARAEDNYIHQESPVIFSDLCVLKEVVW